MIRHTKPKEEREIRRLITAAEQVGSGPWGTWLMLHGRLPHDVRD